MSTGNGSTARARWALALGIATASATSAVACDAVLGLNDLRPAGDAAVDVTTTPDSGGADAPAEHAVEAGPVLDGNIDFDGPCMNGTTACVGIDGSTTAWACTAPLDGGPPGWVSMACVGGLVCERYAPASCVSPVWAEWPWPNSPGDVEGGAPNLQSYADNGDGTITDNVTQLIWQRLPATATTDAGTVSATLSQPNAIAYCAALRLAGDSDWRLPSIIELASIVDFSAYDPALNSIFDFAKEPQFWSSTPVATTGQTGGGWTITFSKGEVSAPSGGASTQLSVRCVR